MYGLLSCQFTTCFWALFRSCTLFIFLKQSKTKVLYIITNGWTTKITTKKSKTNHNHLPKALICIYRWAPYSAVQLSDMLFILWFSSCYYFIWLWYNLPFSFWIVILHGYKISCQDLFCLHTAEPDKLEEDIKFVKL